jgi:hypothetical protein
MNSLHPVGPHRRFVFSGLLLGGLLLAPATPALRLVISPAQAQVVESAPLYRTLRGVNLARMRAESLNGGLIVYRAQACMYTENGGPCLLSSSPNGLLFRFLGGPPGWQEQNQPATVESEILVSPDGRQVLNVIYNGKPRPAN